nr:ribonuclease H-like domain, reverse transcriptase, RNA-dependent DNA polymerase [Tanacetum cinerariifolium]
MAMLSIKVHRFEKKHGRKIKLNGRENARFDKKLVKCFNCKKWVISPGNVELKLESDAKSEGEVVSADDVIPAVVSVSNGLVVAAAVSISAGPVVAAAA